MSPGRRDPRIKRALDYPYHWSGDCFVFHDGGPHPVAPGQRKELRRERTPVLAYGSNRAPEQLARKFGRLPLANAILVERCHVEHWDVVHSAHITSYGAVPAALHRSPGTRIKVAVTWLDDEQLAAMDHSESAGRNYARQAIGAARVGDDGFETLVEAYLTSHGPLRIGSEVAGHGDIEAEGRILPAIAHREVLRRIHQKWGAGSDFADFVLELAEDAEFRGRITDLLKHGL